MRIEQLTFTRFIAAVSIVIFHFGSGRFPLNILYPQFIFKQANVSVSYFFILSGFVMIVAYYKNSKIDLLFYMKNRFARIYPVYFIAIFLLLLLSILSKNLDYQGLILNLLIIQAWVPGKALAFNIPGWSLSVEFLFYVLFPFLFNSFYSKIPFKKLIFPIVLFWMISQIFYHVLLYEPDLLELMVYKIDASYFPLMHLNEFLVGNIAGLYFVKSSLTKRNFDLFIIGIVMLIALVLRFPIGLNFHNGLLALLFIPLIILLALNDGKISVLFKSKVCVFLGEISFGIYILQFVVWQWISDYRLEKYFGIDKVEDFIFSFFLRLFILIFISSISYIYVETPIRNRIKRITLN